MGGAGIGADLLEDEDVSSVLLQPHRIGFDVSKDPIEVVLVDTQELAAILSRDNRRRPGRFIFKEQCEQCDQQKRTKSKLQRPKHFIQALFSDNLRSHYFLSLGLLSHIALSRLVVSHFVSLFNITGR